jgi:iron(III) transport system substrate-binding protein
LFKSEIMMSLSRRLFLAAAAMTLSTPLAWANGVVNVYSYRQPQLVAPLFKAFTAKTGIEVKMVFAEKGLIERIEQEGAVSPADVLLTADVGRMVEAADKGLAQPVVSDAIDSKIPANLRDEAHQWFSLTMRARVVYASRARVSQDTISYEELADPKWKGKLCSRPFDHPYNLGLTAFYLAKKGEAETRKWLEGVKSNFATRPNGNDRSQAKSIMAGECDIAIGNTYYMGLMLNNDKEPEQKDWAKASKIIFPASPAMGTHVNVSGMVLTKAAPNKDHAIRLMEFLASDEAQALYAAGNYEYPVNPAVRVDATVAAWGTLTPDSINIRELARNLKRASELVAEVDMNS